MDSSDELRRCIYCDQIKGSSLFSLEHIFPAALGGKLCNSLFKTRSVCRDCNSKVGTFVDSPFIKNWFVKNDNAMYALDHVDLNSNYSIFPLIYLGVLESIDFGDDVTCEVWMGGFGARFYHIHRKDDKRWDSFAGGNPIERNKDPGRVYFVNTNNDIDWIKIHLRTLRQSFKKARRYATNISIQNDDKKNPFFHKPDALAQREIDLLSKLSDSEHKIKVVSSIDFEQRFLAKIARGLGYKILGEEYLRSEYSYHLLAALNEKDPNLRRNFRVRGSGYLNNQNSQLNKLMAWEGAYTLSFNMIRNTFSMSMYLPSTKGMHVVISDEPKLWLSTALKPYIDGVIYLIIPQLGRFVGPLSLPQFLLHRQGSVRIPELMEIERLSKNRQKVFETP